MSQWKPRTTLAQALGKIDAASRAIVPPIHVSTTYERDDDNQYRSGNSYGRPDNETVREAEAILAALEQGAGAMVLGSGMSAAVAVFKLAIGKPCRTCRAFGKEVSSLSTSRMLSGCSATLPTTVRRGLSCFMCLAVGMGSTR